MGDRGQDSFGRWLEHHQAVELASRDRSTEYRAAIAASKYHIIEVADKLHLIKNIPHRFTKVLSEHYSEYRNMVRNRNPMMKCMDPGPDISENPIPCSRKKEDARKVMFNEVKELQKKGFKPFSISKKLGISRQTATKYCSTDTLLERRSKLRNGYHAFDRYVEEEAEKGKPLSTIYTEIKEQGFKGIRTPFYDHYHYLSDGHRGFRAKSYKPHKNSSRPATVQALAYTQGTDIHVDPDQQQHLPHEAWHVAQQMAGRVEPTTEVGGLPVNDNVALEQEADVMGARENSF